MKAQEKFLAKHGLRPRSNYAAYHYAYGLYVLYMIEAMQMAEDIEDGVYFDETAAIVLIENLSQAQETMQFYRAKMDVSHKEFDIAETIALKSCRLEAGKLIGSKEEAVRIARMWIKNYKEKGGTLFSFEVGIYILFLLQEEMDYSFLNNEKKY